MVVLVEWPEISAVVKDKRFELVVKDLKSDARHPSIDDEDLQKAVFHEKSHVNFVSITNCTQTVLHSCIGLAQSLTKLVIVRNMLKEVPASLGKLKKMTFLDLSHNEITSLPESFSQLKKLETLDISSNKLTSEGLFDMSKLEMLHVLDFSHNELTEIPESMFSGKLSHLHTINFSNNKIIQVPSKFDVLEHIKDLKLASNQLTSIPGAIGRLEKVKFLDLSENPFKDGRFKKLTNDKRAKVSAVLAYVVKNAPKQKEDDGSKPAQVTKESEETSDLPSLRVNLGVPNISVSRLSSVATIRPYLVCCVIRNLDLKTGDNFKKFINIQTKLHGSVCNNRLAASIGTHEFKAFVPPLTYLALPPDQLHITALHHKAPISGRELVSALVRDAELARKRTKRNTLNPLHRYLNLVKDLETLPCIIDANGLVISLHPVTNSDLTKMSEDTCDVWLEVSSNESLQVCKTAMNDLIKDTIAISPDISIDQVRVTDQESGAMVSAFPDSSDLDFLVVERISHGSQ